MTAPPDDCLARNEWICGAYVSTRSEILADAVVQHLQLAGASVALGPLLALPLAVAARRRRWAAGPVLAITTVLYAIPAPAMFSLLLPAYGLSAAPGPVRRIMAGLRAVPEETRQAARGRLGTVLTTA
ncbi:ABC transporter permease, partial [Streptomyces wedmorensis]